ncbi:MAG TPA: hypothetical protein VGM44_18730, partial [Polyangiaceae bacterium]
MKTRLGRSAAFGAWGTLACALAWACGSPSAPTLMGGTSGSSATGQTGALAGPCFMNNTCNAELACVAGFCVPTSLGAGGTTGAAQGSLAGPCYANNTCNTNLTCTAGICFPSEGTGGSTGIGGAGQGGSSSQAGTGQTQGGTGQAQGGSAQQGGTSSAGSSQGGSG